MKKQLLILFSLCISAIGFSQTFTENFITYQVISSTNNTVRTQDYNQAGGTVVNIPASVTDTSTGNTYSVTEIGIDSFFNKQLTSVTIPNSVQYIINFAFATNQLTTITIPDSVISIGGNAFVNNQLNNITFSNGLTAIGLAAFATNQLTSITIPASVNSIAGQAFNNNPLNSVNSLATVPPAITSGSGDSFGNRSVIDLTIPSGTSADYTAGGWTGFNSVTEASALVVGDTFVVDFITYEVTSATNNTVEAIDYDFVGGVNVNIPATVSHSITAYDVTTIGNAAFIGDIVAGEQLANVTIPNGVLSIAENAFNGNNLINITIPDSVISVGGQAFAFNDLTNVVIGNNVETIGINAFRNNQLVSVIIPASITNIDGAAFHNNPLTSIISLAVVSPTIVTGINDTFGANRNTINLVITNNTTDEYVTNSGALWTGFKMVFEATSPTTVEVSNYDSANGTDVIIPATVTAGSNVFDVFRIENSAFENIGLTSVAIPDSVTEIGISAFELNNLTSVTIPDSVTTIGTAAFAQNSISNLSLGTNVTDIGIGAFVDNDLADVTIPSNVTFIGLLAFGNNPLTDVTSLATVPPTITTGTNDTFAFNRSNIHLHIPPGTMGVYVTDPGALWTGFNPVTEDALSINDFELADNVKVITTSYEITIIASNNITLQNYTLYSITGDKVSTGDKSSISTTALANGIYILKLNFDSGTLVKKVAVY